MIYRKSLETTAEMADWSSKKYTAMGGTWNTPPGECNRHLDDLGVPFDKSKWLLDVGCGGGHFLAEAEKRVSCSGLEVSKVALELAASRLKQAHIHKESIENTGWMRDSFDYIVSIGSLEHVIDLDRALDEIYRLLKQGGRWYFYVPNEKWNHFDHPNERTATEPEWEGLLARHRLITDFKKRWNDSTAFAGGKEEVLRG